MSKYALGNEWEQARHRLSLLEQAEDPTTIAMLERSGISDGWNCLEVGGGAGSISVWMAQRVGPSGHVLSVDIDTRFLDQLDIENLTVKHHDILEDPLPDQEFDLVHVRAVLTHMPGREHAALTNMISALKPGGWILVEEPDYPDMTIREGANKENAELRDKVGAEIIRFLATRGSFSNSAGRSVPQWLVQNGVELAHAEARMAYGNHGSPTSQFNKLTNQQLQQAIGPHLNVTAEEFDRVVALYDDPDFAFWGHLLVSALGRKPR